MKRPLPLLLVAIVTGALISPARAQIKVIALAVNTEADEDEPHVSSDGKTLYYLSNARKKFDVMKSTRGDEKGAWSRGKPDEDLNGKANTRGVFLTPDNVFPQRLYFATDKDVNGKKGDNYDLHVLTKLLRSSDFTSEQGLRFCTKEDEQHPWLTKDGDALYFSRKTEEGWRVYVASQPKGGGPFGEAVPVEGLPAGFHHATLTPDGKTMYLQGPLGEGRWGLFRSTRGTGDWRNKPHAGWGKPEPLKELNADGPTGDRSPNLSRDGLKLYFASDRLGGKGGLDLYVVGTRDLKR
jgi:hypothetical protein